MRLKIALVFLASMLSVALTQYVRAGPFTGNKPESLGLAVLVADAPTASDPDDDRLTDAQYREIEARSSAAFAGCLKTAKAMRAIQECDSQEVKYQQDQLDQQFSALMKAMPGDQAKLQADQATWVERKDAKCFVFSRRRGSLNSLKAMHCLRYEIIKRRLELEKYPVK